MPPRFRSFDEAWDWFVADAGELVTAEAARERLGGRAQLLTLQAAADAAPIRAIAQRVLDEVRDVDTLLPHPMNHLHVSLRTAGFQVVRPQRRDEIARDDVGRIARQAAAALKGARRVPARLGPVNVFPDAIVLEVHDGGLLGDLRERLAAASRLDEELGFDSATYLPHVTIASFLDATVAGPLRERLPDMRRWPGEHVELRRVDLARHWFTGLDASDPPEVDVVRSYALR